jgi:hypothetical protein
VVIIIIGVVQLRRGSPPASHDAPSPAQRVPAPSPATAPAGSNAALLAAVAAHKSGVEVEAYGRVSRLLADDNEGSRHQRFLVRIGERLMILVAHNRDLAPRIPVQVGDSVTLRGEYIWNEKGGMIHWTHHDPAGRHEGGWVEYDGKRFE